MKKGYIFIILTALFYSTQEISGKFLASKGKMDPFQVMFIVFFIGAIILFPLAIKDIKSKNIEIDFNDLIYIGICGVLSATISMSMLQFAVTYTQASTSAVLFCTNSIFTVPFAYFILKEKVKKTTLISMAISLVGVVIIFQPAKVISGMNSSRDFIGILFAFGAAIVWSLYTVLSKKKINKYGGYVFNFIAFSFGVLALLLILIFTNRPIFHGVTTNNIIVLLYMGIFIKAIGYICYLGAVKETSAVTASTVFLIKPALATILSVVVLSEKIALSTIVGIVFIVLGSYINFSSNKKENVNNEKTVKV
ncbi:DMT family transporter [Clostridium scatologenes]|uniref:OrfY n=1 Tax=Clostridium scatologenes TaxID=1548 RepID=A0A0E3K2U4_CLOSL|nr:EamA family transporter [Clostridium scatologenes]AKA70743.1 OrfY [Clostridium scatologenes]